MPVLSRSFGIVIAGALLALAACGGGGDAGGTAPDPTVRVTAVIGPAGGTLTAPNGAGVVVPPGALSADTTIGIEQSAAGAPAPLSGLVAAGPVVAFTPHGTRFALPVTVTLPFDPASVPAGRAPALLKTNAQAEWEPVIGTRFDGSRATGQVHGFSHAQVVVPPLQRLEASQQWTFKEYPGNGLPPKTIDENVSSGVLLERFVAFGPTPFDAFLVGLTETLLPDGLANGMLFSTADGVTFGSFAEAPSARLGGAAPIGGGNDFFQTQTFIKRADDATLTFTITAVLVDLSDFTQRSPTGSVYLRGSAELQVYGNQDLGQPPFFLAEASASVVGENGIWIPSADTGAASKIHVWERDEDFEIVRTDNIEGTRCAGSRVEMRLKRPRTYRVDLSKVRRDVPFTLTTRLGTTAINRKGGGSANDCQGSYAAVFLRDPQQIGGTTLFFTGLEPVATTQPPPPSPTGVRAEPAACTPGPGPDPQAGVLQFDAASYTVAESPGAAQRIVVTRSGGSRGAVSATFATRDGSALAGTDYTAVAATVFFADGEAGSRTVQVPILPNATTGADKTVALGLSEPGGCAALGARTDAVLTIRDDDGSDEPPPASGLDPSFGSGGKVATPGLGGENSAMAVQADGKILLAGGPITEFVLARYNADGSADATFGIGGKVTTDMIAGGIVQEEARAVAVQPDGRIVVAGYTRTGLPFGFALARYHPDGRLDTTFGSGGKVVGGLGGRAFAVAIQPDGRIVAAGDDPTVEMIKVVRYLADGRVDTGFGTGGEALTDVPGDGDRAANVVLQTDGAIVVSGDPIGGLSVGPTSLVRYTADGRLDPAFGAGGKLTLSGQRVGEGLALQGDGKLVLVGGVDTPTAVMTGFAVTRLLPDGRPDPGFGNAGSVHTVVDRQGGDAARAVAIQPDGRIVVAGVSGRINPNFALARYGADGTLDSAFASGGLATVDFFGARDAAEGVAVLPDGRILLGGVARQQVDGYALARFRP